MAAVESGLIDRARQWLQRPETFIGLAPPRARRLGLLWVGVSLPVVVAVSALVDTPDAYLYVLILLAFGPYTVPGLVAGRHAVRYAPDGDRLSYELLQAGLVGTVTIGLCMLVRVATGWQWAAVASVLAVVVAGVLHIGGLAMLVRHRSGERAVLVDVIETAASVLAVAAPLVVLWWPAVFDAEARWFTVACSIILLFTMTGTYWLALLWVRIGPGPAGIFEGASVVSGLFGSVTAALQIAQGVSGFTLYPPPLIFLCALCASAYLVIPLYVPVLVRRGLDRLPPQAQVRGSWLPTLVPLAGLGGLLATTLALADERPWVVPFSLVVVSLVAVLGGVRQMAALNETRHLYRQVEAVSDERRRLLAQLLERSLNDRRRVAEQLHKQAIAAYASFTTLAGARGSAPAVAEASDLVRGYLERDADSLRELVLSIRPLEAETDRRPRLLPPVEAYLTTIYGEATPPKLGLGVADELVLDWVVETVLLQIVQEALHNVWRHSQARRVDIAVEAADETVVVRITDDGVGFDPEAVEEGAGIATMRAATAVVDGSLAVESSPRGGTTVVAHLGPGRPNEQRPAPLRLLRPSPSE